MNITSRIRAAVLTAFGVIASAFFALSLIASPSASAATLRPAAPVSFPVYDSCTALVTAHQVHSGERLVIRGIPVQLTDVAHPGGLVYVAHVQGGGLTLRHLLGTSLPVFPPFSPCPGATLTAVTEG